MTEHQFKVGDVVECISEQGEGGIHLGERYTVQQVRGDELFVGTKFDGWLKTRFRPLPSPEQPASHWVPEVGEKVRLNKSWLGPGFVGIELEVVRVCEHCVYTKPHPRIADGEPAFFFEHIEPAPRDSAEAPKEPARVTPCSRCGSASHSDETCACETVRRWDSEVYSGVVSWQPLDQRIAAARELLDMPAPVRFPHVGRNFALERKL